MDAILISQPAPDFDTLLPIVNSALGYNVSAKLDASPIQRTPAERFVSCLAAMRDKDAIPGLQLLSHAAISILIAADSEQMQSVLERCEMPYVLTDTCRRGVQLAVVTGTLLQWKAAIDRGVDLKRLFLANNLNLWSTALRITHD